MTYAEICEMYVRHVKVSYGQELVIFDGYHGPSTKDEAHRRRTGTEVGACVSVSGEMRLTMTNKAFLGNGANKQALIYLLAEEMQKEGIAVEHADEDADFTICKMACSSSNEKPTAVIADDADVFQLLIHHANAEDFDLYMVMSKQTVSINILKKKLDPFLSRGLLFLHAISGCDTTSRPYGIGKATVLKKVSALRNAIDTFMSPSSSKKDVETAGEKALLEIYGCQLTPSLNSARVERFQEKVVTSAEYVPPEKLPPTTDAASFHSYRTYHQVQTWQGNDLPSTDWGWEESSVGLVPVRMSQSAAPESFLEQSNATVVGAVTNGIAPAAKMVSIVHLHVVSARASPA